MKNHIFLQARLNSTRLPEKVLKKICGKTVIELIVERLRQVDNIDDIILVTGSELENKSLIDEAKKLNLTYFCGNDENILDRFYEASMKFNSDNIIRVTGDCPLIDFNVINKGLKIFLEKDFDILSINRKRTFPDGFDYEIFKKKSLHTSWEDNLKLYQNKSEFYTTFISPAIYMLENKKFKNYDLINESDYSYLMLTLDYPQDLELITKIYEQFYHHNKYFALNEILTMDIKPKK